MSSNNSCNLCNKKFSTVSNLRVHVKKIHPEKINEIAPKKVYDNVVTCKECSKTFSLYNNYRRHVLKCHTDKKDTLLSKDISRIYTCSICKTHFSNVDDLQRHNIDAHGVRERKTVLKKICPLCRFESVSRSQLIIHFESVHDLNIMSERKSFLNFEEFMTWKTNLEKTTNMLYRNKLKNQINFNNRKQITYRCHRSGHFQPSGLGIRHLKSQGTSKINGYCPAQMNLKIYDQNKCEVLWTKSHVGHEGEIRHMRLSAAEKSKIASKIAAKIPFAAILDEIRNSNSSCKLERIHLLTRKDLYNIKKCYDLNSASMEHQNDVLNSDSWDTEITGNNYNEFYEPQDSMPEEYAFLKKEKAEQPSIIKTIINNEEQEKTLKVNKERLMALFKEIVNSIDTLDEFEMVSQMSAPIRPALFTMKNSYGEKGAMQNLTSAGPSTIEKIEPQQNAYDIKKRKSEVENKAF